MAVTVLPPLPVSGFEVYETINDPKFEVKKDSDNFVALNGDIKEISYYDGMYENSFDEDYEGISNTGSVVFPKINSKFYKGKKICLKKANDTGTPLKWDDLESCLLGFISEIKYTENEVNVKLVGMSKLLDQEKKFTFKNTKRSKILKEIIESAGLKADIDVSGLKDELIDYTNISSNSSDSSSSSVESTGSATIDEAVQKAIEGKTTDLERARGIDAAFKSHVYYKFYSDCHFSDIDKACKNRIESCNCACYKSLHC